MRKLAAWIPLLIASRLIAGSGWRHYALYACFTTALIGWQWANEKPCR